MVNRVATTAALERIKNAYRRNAGSWALETLGYAEGGETVVSFPLHPPTQNQAMQDQQAAIDWVASWRTHAKLADYVRWESRQWALLGRQDVPIRVEITDPAAVARVAGHQAHWQTLTRRYQIMLQTLQTASAELVGILGRKANVDAIVTLEDADFTRLLDVVTWLSTNPNSGMYIRQLPVRGVDTKWIGSHRRLVTTLHTAHTGATDLGIATEPDRWRIRILDEALQLAGLSDITAPLEQLANVELTPANILIVENLVSLLALPPMDDTVAIFGRGLAVTQLATLPWLHGPRVYYWGDLDTHGLRILHTLRAAGIETTSLLMDLPTLQAFEDLWVHETSPFTGELNLLTRAEAEAYDYLRAHPGTRLEQERIDWFHVVETLQGKGLMSDGLD